jgi:hypothetical protein
MAELTVDEKVGYLEKQTVDRSDFCSAVTTAAY